MLLFKSTTSKPLFQPRLSLNFASESAFEGAAETAIGQDHHLLGNKITSTLNSHPTLSGAFDYSRTNSKYIYKALDDAAHKGYQTWHRQYDATVVKWLQSNPSANPAQFNKYPEQEQWNIMSGNMNSRWNVLNLNSMRTFQPMQKMQSKTNIQILLTNPNHRSPSSYNYNE